MHRIGMMHSKPPRQGVGQQWDQSDEVVEEDFVAAVPGLSSGELVTVRMFRGLQARAVGILTDIESSFNF